MPSLNLRLEDSLHELLKLAARGERRSLNSEIVLRLEASLGLGAREPDAAGPGGSVSAVADETGPDEASSVAPVVAGGQSASRAPSPRRCPREARHHINHSGRPCPECGWPSVHHEE